MFDWKTNIVTLLWMVNDFVFLYTLYITSDSQSVMLNLFSFGGFGLQEAAHLFL